MATKQITLREAVDILAEQGYEIPWSNGSNMQDFFSYYDTHYKPVLPYIAADLHIAEDARRFLIDDITEIMK